MTVTLWFEGLQFVSGKIPFEGDIFRNDTLEGILLNKNIPTLQSVKLPVKTMTCWYILFASGTLSRSLLFQFDKLINEGVISFFLF